MDELPQGSIGPILDVHVLKSIIIKGFGMIYPIDQYFNNKLG